MTSEIDKKINDYESEILRLKNVIEELTRTIEQPHTRQYPTQVTYRDTQLELIYVAHDLDPAPPKPDHAR